MTEHMDERNVDLRPEDRADMDLDSDEPMDSRRGDGEHHATTGGSALAGAVTGGVIGMAGGPVGAAVGAIGGAIVGAAAERTMHHDDDREGEEMGLDNDRDGNWAMEDRAKEGDTMAGTGTDTTRPGWTGTDTTMHRATTGGERTVELHEEQVTPVKERVQTGEVEIRKEVITENKTMEVPVTREEVVIERHPVDRRPADRADFRAESETVRVPVTEERVSIEKTPVVTEEVTVGTRARQETEHVAATVRREEAHVERHGDTDTGSIGQTDTNTMPGHTHNWVENSCSCGASR